MAVKAGEIIALLEELAPIKLQADWDNSGLQVGDEDWPVEKVLLALDITLGAVEYAAVHGFTFILSHHPLIFRKLSQIDAATPLGACLAAALAKRICIYSLHTNLDFIQGGVSDCLAELLQLQNIQVLDKSPGRCCKLVVFVPDSHLDEVRRVLGDAGAGWLGNYSHCTFASPGQGQFLPRAGASPWSGRPGELSQVSEQRLETILPQAMLPRVLRALKGAHPYEEPAYDIIPLENKANLGLGRIGRLPEQVKLSELAARVAQSLACASVRVSGDPEALVERAAVCGGSGSDLIALAQARGAQVLVTGDVGHHDALEAANLGLALVDPGHYKSELPVLGAVQSYLQRRLPGVFSAVYPGERDPIWFLPGQGEFMNG